MRFFLFLLLVAGCGGSSSSPHGLGGACTMNADCTTDNCAINADYPGGYCWIQTCATAADCGDNGDCSNGGNALGGGCMLKCNDSSDCRSGYHCCPDFNQVKVCAPVSGTAISC
jgi:hypothetical protein